MRPIRATAALMLLALPCTAGAQSPQRFGAASYSPPPGWALETRPTLQTLTRIRGTELCMVVVYADEPSPPGLDRAFAQAWSTVFNASLYRSAPLPQMAVRTSPAGHRHAAGEGELVDNGNNRFIARMHVFPAGERTQTVVLLGNGRAALDACRPEWDTFFASLRFPSVEPEAAAGRGAPAAAGQAAAGAGPAASNSRADSSFPPGSRAGSLRFENFVFVPPAGWKAEQSGDAAVLTPAEMRGDEVLRLLLLPGRPAAGDLRQEFARSWSEVASTMGAEPMRSVNGGPFDLDEPGRSARGWEYLHGSGGMRVPGGGAWSVELYVIKAGDRFERIVAAARDFRDNTLMTSALAGARWRREIQGLVFTLGFTNLPAVDVAPAGVRGGGVTGVWAGMAMSFGTLKPHFAIFFDNGMAYFGPGFPARGLSGIDPSVEEHGARRYWGRYTTEAGTGTITMPYGTIPLRLAGPDLTLTTNNTDHRFGRLTMPDPGALVGTWCLDDGRCLRLAGDGRFEDGGAVRVLEHSTYPFPESPGSGRGRYEVRDYTLTLRYDQGPEVRLAFLGLAGTPAAPLMLVSFNVDVLTRR
jgi:hypothetical protein